MKEQLLNVNKQKTLKRLSFLFFIILLIFTIINSTWYFGYKKIYINFAEQLEECYIGEVEEPNMLRYEKTIDGYSLSLKMPEYLGSGGFLTIGRSEGYITETDEKGNIISTNGMYVSLYIWPQYFGGYKTGIDFYDKAEDIWVQIEVKEDLEILNSENLDDEYVSYVNSLIDENREEIINMINIVENLFKIKIFE